MKPSRREVLALLGAAPLAASSQADSVVSWFRGPKTPRPIDYMLTFPLEYYRFLRGNPQPLLFSLYRFEPTTPVLRYIGSVLEDEDQNRYTAIVPLAVSHGPGTYWLNAVRKPLPADAHRGPSGIRAVPPPRDVCMFTVEETDHAG